MRPAWAVVAGILGAGALAWWFAREPSAGPAPVPPAAQAETDGAPQQSPGPSLYRWRDEAGVVQITDIPPRDREYTLVDVAALERRNVIDPDPVPSPEAGAPR